MVGVALVRRLKMESCTILAVDRAELDLTRQTRHGAMDRCSHSQNKSATVCAFRSLSALWPARAGITLGAENVTVKACDPPLTAGGNVQVANGGLGMSRNSFPIKLRVEFREIGRHGSRANDKPFLVDASVVLSSLYCRHNFWAPQSVHSRQNRLLKKCSEV